MCKFLCILPGNVFVDALCRFVQTNLQSFVQVITLFTVLNGRVKQLKNKGQNKHMFLV